MTTSAPVFCSSASILSSGTFADGRILTGKDAKEAGLVDQLGYIEDAYDKARSLADAPEAGVPLPAKTQFDGNPRIRAIYLEYYALGYRSANAEYASPGCMCVAEGDAERYDAAWSGFFDGKTAGTAATVSPRPSCVTAPCLV